MSGDPVERMSVLDGAVQVQGPDGYCIDSRASQPGKGFVVLGSCAAISSKAVQPLYPALMTVQIGPANSAAVAGAEGDMLSLLTSAQGAALLADGGNGGTVRITGRSQTVGMVAVSFVDSGATHRAGLAPDQWRAFIDLSGRLVTVGIRSFANRPLSDRQGQSLLTAAVAALRQVNP